MEFIGIDLGTSFLKGAVLDEESCAMRAIHREPFPDRIAGLDPLLFEVRTEDAVAATRRLLDRLGEEAPDCAGVVMCSQMHGMVLTEESGSAVTNIITWQDQRALERDRVGNRYFDRLAQDLDEDLLQRLGNGLKPSLPLCTLDWMAQTGKLQDGWRVCSLPDYVLSQLSASQPVMEPTMAASMGAYDVVHGQWHEEVIQRIGADGLLWPEIAPFDRPYYTISLGDQRVPCYPPVGDHQCAIAGSLMRERELSINISTGSQVSLVVESWQPGDYEVRPYFGDRYLNTISRIPAGRSLSVLMDLLLALPNAAGQTIDDPWRLVGQAVDSVPETDLDVDLSFFATMFGDEGHIRHIREDNLTPGHLFRAAFQTMAANYLTCAKRISPAEEWRSIVFSGGLARRFDALRTQVEKRFAVRGRLCPTEEDTMLGLMVLATLISSRAGTLGAATETVEQRFPRVKM